MSAQARLVRAGSAFHSWLYRASGGALGGRVGKAPVLLLTHRGRKTGLPRTSPLLYLADGERLVVVASNGGAAEDPGWFRNLEAHPEAEVQLGRRRRLVRARRATPEERDRYWPLLDALYRPYASYRRRAPREIPLVVLEPVGQADAPRAE